MKDSHFCSAEHRLQFHAQQQQLMLERLQRSAYRLSRFRPGVLTGTAAAVSDLPAQAAEVPAPLPPYASLIAPPLQLVDRAVRLLGIGPFHPVDAEIFTVGRDVVPGRNGIVLAAACPDYPCPRPHSAIQTNLQWLTASFPLEFGLGSVLEKRNSGWRQPGALDWLRFAVAPRDRKPSVDRIASSSPLPLADFSDCGKPAFQVTPQTRTTLRSVTHPLEPGPGAMPPVAGLRGCPVQLPSADAPMAAGLLPVAMPQSGRAVPVAGLAPCSRLYRSRPRNPKQDAATTLPKPEMPPSITPAAPAVLSATLESSGLLPSQPKMLDKLFRMRPRSGKSSGAISLQTNLVPLESAAQELMRIPTYSDVLAEHAQESGSQEQHLDVECLEDRSFTLMIPN